MPRDQLLDGPRPRNRKIEAELQRALAAIIARELKDPRVGNVTISAVDLAPDKRMARVYFTPFASAHSPAEVRAGLTRAAGFLRGEVSRRLGLRYAPRLQFVFDDAFDKAAELTNLIKQAVARDRGDGEA
ncbi:MAG TPA: 30S ribosome-binding factor RbfA [Steroidobacteraceae bacterium]|jgi:ribosome-binding factor A|nr:30S ribosome-binding factor RbfA [Steroidobacteraceae bacterium]